MKFKKIFSILIIFSVFVTSVFAHGKKDIEELDASNLNSWAETFNLEGKKGKYNILITATDLGGNVYVEGPHNIMVDPESDKCVAGITNPVPNMRVVGNLNIVGTCVDDDGVDYVEVVLDGNEEAPVRAFGREFWSFYLDTKDLEEGPHSIKVTGYDINGLQGKSATCVWQLDRRQPVTSIKEKDMETDKPMGMLVSGTVKFQGLVEDGNGIKRLEYSIDNGETYNDVKITPNDKKGNATFAITVNTKAFPDGPAVLWFKATDKSGSVGAYSFLYFIDNTNPEVKIITPTKEDTVNGKFSVAGYAKDRLGITALKWTFGTETGDVELIPGNPYWCIDFDTIGSKDKSRKFSISATDLAGNVVETSMNISLNQEDDKPVVTLAQPLPGTQYSEGEELYVRGIVNDDNDGVRSVIMSVDAGQPVEVETKGVFFYSFGNSGQYTSGKHKLTVIGVDANGVEGNPVVIELQTLGQKPQFESPQIVPVKGDAVDFVSGIEVHPESSSKFAVNITSTAGLKSYSVNYWSEKGEMTEPNVVTLKKPEMNAVVSIPVTPSFPKGIVHFEIKATDISDRENTYKGFFYVTNTTEIKQDKPAIVFEDSRVDSEGRIINNQEFPASGYVIGAVAKKIEVVPETPFVSAALKGNQIQLKAGRAVGTSEKVVIRITTDKDDVIESIPLTFVNDSAVPALTISSVAGGQPSAYDAISIKKHADIKISGKATCETGMNKVRYRILSANVDMVKGVVSKVGTSVVPEEFETASMAPDGTFTITVPTPADDPNAIITETEDGEPVSQDVLDEAKLLPGVYIVEIVAESAAGNTTVKTVAYKKIPELEPDSKGKMPVAKAPVVAWFNGYDVYATGIYQGDLEESFHVFPRADMIEGVNSLTWNATPYGGKPVAGKFSASKDPTLSANFVLVNEENYLSGTPVVLEYGNDKNYAGAKIIAYIDTGVVVNSATYEISGLEGDETPGGDSVQTGSAKLTKPAAGETRWVAEIPLKNLPSRVTKVKLTIKAGTLETSITGFVRIVRPASSETYTAVIDDKEAIYDKPSADMNYDFGKKQYGMTGESVFSFFANVPGPITAVLEGADDGLKADVDGERKIVRVTPAKDGIYKNVRLVVTDALGDLHSTGTYSFIVDSGAPEVKLVSPVLCDWVGKVFKLQGTAADVLGVNTIEYSLNNGETWTQLELSSKDPNKMGVTFSKDIDISGFEDGLVQIDVRGTDNGGNSVVERTAVYKDVTPPEVFVVLPASDDIVNGETMVIFNAHDNACLAKAEYVMPAHMTDNEANDGRSDIELNPLVHTIVGTVEQPIDDKMSFEFFDAAGNKTKVGAWAFLIDNESDLPIAEIHLPDETHTITRDFTISGVVYDDDGAASIFYKIDNGDYIAYPEVGTSFSIPVSITTLLDNEHTVTVYAVDQNGVKGPETSRTFRVSLNEPKAVMAYPEMDASVRGVVELNGFATDKNGIQSVKLSIDNGNTYNDTILTNVMGSEADWTYVIDTRVIPGGSQVVFLRTTDNYGIEGLYSTLINIDNEAPILQLESPVDESETMGNLFFSGVSYDNLGIIDMKVSIRSLDKEMAPLIQNMKIERVISEYVDITSLPDGFYNIELTAKDAAGNTSNVSRNIHLNKNKPLAVVDILYPLNGETKTGEFNVYGQVEAEGRITSLALYIDGQLADESYGDEAVRESGFYMFSLNPDKISDGTHKYRVDVILDTGMKVSSREQTINYKAFGPWVTIDNFVYGDFAAHRPILKGRAGYTRDPDEELLAKEKTATPEFKAKLAAKSVETIELSLDNGKTFIPLSKNEKWKYRIENQDLSEGYHFLLIRATMKNGEKAIERLVVQIDNTKPTVKLISPEQGGHYNQELLASGLSNDDVKLEEVKIALRKGDKASYEVPKFIQGLYLDVHFWGATLFDVGAGLTFFDDNVKLQFQWGEYTQTQRDFITDLFQQPRTQLRYGGDVFGLKLLANIADIPFAFFLGHDFDWLSANIAIGANFSLFTMTNSGQAQILSAILAQLEFPRITFPEAKAFSTLSFYTEGSLWFIPTDVATTVDINKLVPQISFGIRANVF